MQNSKAKTEELGDVVRADKVKRGQLLRFNYEGSPLEFIVTYVNKKTQKVRARRTTTFHPGQVTIKEKK